RRSFVTRATAENEEDQGNTASHRGRRYDRSKPDARSGAIRLLQPCCPGVSRRPATHMRLDGGSGLVPGYRRNVMRRLHKTIFEIGWTRTVPRLAETDPVATAFDLMSRESHDCVLIARGERLVGIFTSRDFLNRVAAVRADPRKVTLAE